MRETLSLQLIIKRQKKNKRDKKLNETIRKGKVKRKEFYELLKRSLSKSP